tara:strand:- start:1349 stop:2032 length:684 start_codon:yes stop_codon:yes gene_type:complete
MSRNITAIIPARGGSKGIYKKNIYPLMGKPLILWTIEAALKSCCFNKIIVSTDDQEIADIAKSGGVDVPTLRPAYLSTDKTPIIKFVLELIKKDINFEDIMLLQPTSPLRDHIDIKNIIKLKNKLNSNSAVSVVKSINHPNLAYEMENFVLNKFIKSEKILPRQLMKNSYNINGAIYLASRDYILKEKEFYGSNTIGYEMPPERSIDIDNYIDIDWAEFLLKKKLNI